MRQVFAIDGPGWRSPSGIALHSEGAPGHERFAWLVFSPTWDSFSIIA